MTNSILEISEVRVLQPEWRITLQLDDSVHTGVEKRCTRDLQHWVDLRVLAQGRNRQTFELREKQALISSHKNNQICEPVWLSGKALGW